jgi:hypothetical protein
VTVNAFHRGRANVAEERKCVFVFSFRVIRTVDWAITFRGGISEYPLLLLVRKYIIFV